ncbi:MAG: type II toxin-antitoxin system RelE/ParE family toxin [Pseudomonadota bacterium]|nr:type II toxin-antitoxin system RelE/ParE family toxin [Pseudomonadota bacterium]
MYQVTLTPSARRDLLRLDFSIQKRIVNGLEKLARNPIPAGVEKLSGAERFWRIRIGDYRIVYAVDEDHRLVIAAIIRHRKDVYKDLGKLDAKTVLDLVLSAGSGKKNR